MLFKESKLKEKFGIPEQEEAGQPFQAVPREWERLPGGKQPSSTAWPICCVQT